MEETKVTTTEVATVENNVPAEKEKKPNLFVRFGRSVKKLGRDIKENPVVLAVGSVIGAIGTVAIGVAANALTGGKTEETDDEPVETDFVETNETPEE